MSSSRFKTISGTFLIAGTMIGAGMLGIPLVTAPSGLIPGIVSTLIVWFFMYCTGLLFLEATLWMPDGSNVLSIAGRYLGRKGRVISALMFIFLYYCLMIAYFAAGSPMLSSLLSFTGIELQGWQIYAFFGLIFGSVVAIGPKSIDRVNVIMSVAMLASWLFLIGSGSQEVKMERLIGTHYSLMPWAMPVLFSAFGFHNVIPSLCSYLQRDRKALKAAIFWGSLIPLIVYIVWQWLVIGAIAPDLLTKGVEARGSVIEAFSSHLGNEQLLLFGGSFAFFAIVTSTLGVSFSMVDFLGDGFKVKRRSGMVRAFLTLLTFFPPFFLASNWPGIFEEALGVAGGFGEAFLNGLLPISLVWIGTKRFKESTSVKILENRAFLLFLALYTLFVVGVEMVQLFRPGV